VAGQRQKRLLLLRGQARPGCGGLAEGGEAPRPVPERRERGVLPARQTIARGPLYVYADDHSPDRPTAHWNVS
jgi:hypothetical protein